MASAERVTVGIDHRCDPDLALAEAAGDRSLVRPLDELPCEQERHLDGKPLPGVMAAHEQQLADAGLPFADSECQDRPVLEAAPDLLDLDKLRPPRGELPHVLLEALSRMEAIGRRAGRKRREMLAHRNDGLDAVTHLADAIEHRLRGTQHEPLRLRLPDVKPQRHAQELRQRPIRILAGDAGNDFVHEISSGLPLLPHPFLFASATNSGAVPRRWMEASLRRWISISVASGVAAISESASRCHT